jgi:MFS family permease
VLVLLIIYIPTLSLTQLIILFFALGFITSANVISYPTIAESNPKILTATSVSIVSICAIGGYAVFQPLFGWIMDSHWAGQMQGAARVYSAADYHFAITLLPVMFAVALIAAIFIRETRCKPMEM